jgi:hypothetical protein
LEGEYFTYWLLSEFVHSASTQLFRYWTESDGVISLCYGPTSSVEDPYLFDATRWLIEIVACAASAFELDMVEEIKMAAKSLSEVEVKALGNPSSTSVAQYTCHVPAAAHIVA